MNSTEKAKKGKHPIQVASRRSGLSADVIRVWERRYNAVKPERSGINRRLYSDEDVERLLLLARVTRAGRRIGDVATLSLEELRAMVEEDNRAAGRVIQPSSGKPKSKPVRHYFDECIKAIDDLDGTALDAALTRASVDLSVPVLMEQLLTPLMEDIGKRWHKGDLRVANEHMATAHIRSFLGSLRSAGSPPDSAPEIVVATPAGTRHEIGALIVALLAAGDGWKVTYLGPDLPAEEIAAAARNKNARVVALSIIYPMDDPQLGPELRRLAGLLGENVSIFVGGASAVAYREVLEEIGARLHTDVTILRAELQKIRTEG